ncbi:hypothetical protein QU487_16090 [Crenobacter sp. SG2305]|uniref:hypothetical protein n=1 Tax=Crenobacter oryzisoli TaxID=3056844 RepID=UPI0025AAA539|nr:hypothetical protein [Crenobacter sp. SG2305]MDN0084261.1 hypothetical protein [Crenobacter sp. SG2305]
MLKIIAKLIKIDKLLILSGIQQGGSGVGRLMAELQDEISDSKCHAVLITGDSGRASFRMLLKNKQLIELFYYALQSLKKRVILTLVIRLKLFKIFKGVVLIHPQTIGFDRTLHVLKSHKNAWLYLMDNSFFCVASYNFLEENHKECTSCLGGVFENSIHNRCKPFPVKSKKAHEFTQKIFDISKSNNINLLTQNEKQNELARLHLKNSKIIKIGLRTSDMPNAMPDYDRQTTLYDVCFHGAAHNAKGFAFSLALARARPDLKFFFPCKNPDERSGLDNCTFVECSWESGLKEAVIKSKLTLVPSLWSAPIEGALIKSIAFAKKVVAVESKYSYTNEIPDSIVYKISSEVDVAAQQLDLILEADSPSYSERKYWYDMFISENENILKRMISVSMPLGK